MILTNNQVTPKSTALSPHEIFRHPDRALIVKLLPLGIVKHEIVALHVSHYNFSKLRNTRRQISDSSIDMDMSNGRPTTEYWKSQERKFCDFCQCWIADNKPSIQSHENGKRHKESVAKKISAMSKKSIEQHKESLEIDRDMKRMEAAAMKAYLNDIKSNPDFTSHQIIQQLEERGQLDRLDEIPKEKSPPPKKKSTVKSKDTVQSSSTEPVKRTPWVEAKSDGNTYYWNIETNESTWEVPEEGFVTAEDHESELLAEKARAESMKEELRAFKAREEMKKLRPAEKEANADTSGPMIGPAPKPDPYGGWTTVIREVPKKIDLQLPKTQVVPIVVPAVRESRIGMKEKKLESLDADDVPTTFKKRKLGFKGNIRRRTGDDSD